MRMKVSLYLTLILLMVMLFYGLYAKKSYKDLNKESNPLDQFNVGIFPDSLFETYITTAKEKLESSEIIVAVKCLDTMTFRFKCTTQPVEVEHVFQGDLSVNDTINIVRASSEIFMSEDMYINGMPSINMSFVREMIPGETYLLFLNRRIHTFDDEKIYILEDLLITPIFCYSDISNQVCVSDADVDTNSAAYKSVKNNEFFLMSQKSIEEMETLKQALLEQYHY